MIEPVRFIPGKPPRASDLNKLSASMDSIYSGKGLAGGTKAAMVRNTINQGVSAGVGSKQPVLFDTVIYDTYGLANVGGNIERMTVPAGVSFVRLFTQLLMNSPQIGTLELQFFRNGAAISGESPTTYTPYGTCGGWPDKEARFVQLATPVIKTAPGDYYTVAISILNDGSGFTILGHVGAVFAMEVVG